MPQTVPMIGIAADELCWLRMLVSLLRHPDPTIPELTRQALIYLADASRRGGPGERSETRDNFG